MKIVFGGYQTLGMTHGGPYVQALQTKKGLELLGVEVKLFNQWDAFSKHSFDLFHLFAANIGTFHLARNLFEHNTPYVTSPIFFTQHSPLAIKSTLLFENLLNASRKHFWSNYGMTKDVCRWSKKVLPNTNDEAMLVTAGLGIESSKTVVIPNGVDQKFEFGNPTIFKKKYGVEHFILNVGHIGMKRKNVLNLIRAVKTIDHPVVLIGKVYDSAEGLMCKQEIQQTKNIILIDGLENTSEMLASAYAACDVFALPSLFETPGIAALEAALAGAKIVITPHGGTKDYFDAMATYVEPHSVESIRKGIIKSLNEEKNPLLKEHIKKEFLWSRVVEKTLSVYKSVLK